MSAYCPDCGTLLEDFIEGANMGQRCPTCGWSLVATYTPPILEDNREYTITFLAGNDATLAVFKAISRLKGCNYIAAKELILDAPTTFFVGGATEVLKQKRVLEEAGMKIAITPEFPYGPGGQLLEGTVTD